VRQPGTKGVAGCGCLSADSTASLRGAGACLRSSIGAPIDVSPLRHPKLGDGRVYLPELLRRARSKHLQTLLDLAQRADSVADKNRLLVMAAPGS
jgi:hypothetical protein